MLISAGTRKDVSTDKKSSGSENYNLLMLALRYIYVLTLVVWLGGMLTLGALVAPTIFQVLQAHEPVAGRELAGEVFGAILARFHYVAYAAGAVLLLTLFMMKLLGPRPRAFGARAAIVAAMLITALYSGLIVTQQIEAVQRDAGGAPSKLAANDGRRLRFDELHQLSVRLMLLTMTGALLLLYWEARER
jgi:uncharacterized membrane protein